MKQYSQKIKKNPNLTDFQKKVLLEVLKVPKGQLSSYGQIARKIGFPKAARAVGHAVGINPYAPFVPCHRIITSTGKLGGYSGGLKKKRELLKKEGIIIK